MDKRKFNLWIDRALVPVFVGVIWTGLELHAAGHAVNPGLWHVRALLHMIVSLLFLLLAGIHIHGHRGWYRALRTAGCKGRHRKMVMMLSVFFVLAAATGITALSCGGAPGSHLGILHYLLGLLLGILALLHILKRLRILFGVTKP